MPKLQNQLQHYLEQNNLTETISLDFDNDEFIKIRLIKLALVFNEKTKKIEEQKYGLKVKFKDNDGLTFNTTVIGIQALLRAAKQRFLLQESKSL